MVDRQHYGKSVDWWAIGVMIFELLSGEMPFQTPGDVPSIGGWFNLTFW